MPSHNRDFGCPLHTPKGYELKFYYKTRKEMLLLGIQICDDTDFSLSLQWHILIFIKIEY
jgi:hypothetical protein